MNNLTFSHKANSSPHGFLNKFCQTLYQTFMNSLDYRENGKRLSSFNVDSITLILKLLLLLFSHWVVSDWLQPHELQHARLLCPSLSPWVCSNWCPLSQWCHPNHFILCETMWDYVSILRKILECIYQTSPLVVQWLRSRLPVLGTRVLSLV